MGGGGGGGYKWDLHIFFVSDFHENGFMMRYVEILKIHSFSDL